MNNVAENENETTKEAKKASEADSFQDYEDEAMESNEEGFGQEEVPLSETDLTYYNSEGPRYVAVPRTESAVSPKGSCEDPLQEQLRERWLTVTGRRPRNIPNVKRFGENLETFVHFGDRRPLEIERKMRQNWLLAARKVKTLVPNFGKVLKEVRVPVACEGIMCIRFDAQGQSLATSYRNGGVQVVDPTSGEVLRSLQTLESKDKVAVRGLRYHPFNSEILYIVGTYGRVQVFNTNSSESIHRSVFSSPQMYTLDITCNASNLITGGRNGKICIFDTETLEIKSEKSWPTMDAKALSNLENEYHSMKIYGLKCHPYDPNVFITGSWDSTVKIWDLRVGPAVRSIRGPSVYGEGVDVMDTTIVTASWRSEGSLSLWDLSSGGLIKNIPVRTKTTVFDGEFLYAVRFFTETPETDLVNSNCIAIGGSGFSSLLVINTRTEKTIAAFPTYKAIMSVDVARNLVAYGGKESVFRIGEVCLVDPKQKKAK